ncbi:MAG: type IV secretion system DNA-binding domain-containing protein [Sphaerospermopsis sp. SIO1G1]|nr:type IV secretion system DNA-binding domain-containing protein [Sphaerospermopsis sp. SIO1G1]
MTTHHWQQWNLNGRPQQITFKRLQLPTNPGKPFQAAWGFVSFGIAGWMLRQLQFNENQKSKWDKLASDRDSAIAQIDSQIEIMEVNKDLELSANENAVVIQQAELLGEVEVKLTQMEAAEIIFDAETAGMTDEQKQSYVEFIRNQQSPFLTGTQTLEQTINPHDKVDGSNNQYLTPDWFTHAVDYFCVLIWGGQGGGKTTALSHLVQGKKDKGQRIVILDPHAAKGQWSGLEVIGPGLDYEAIDDFMGWYEEESKRRYQLLRNEGEEAVRKLGAICVVAEELTNYAKRCKNSGDFIQACLSDNRKIFFSAIFISHGRTLALTGGSQGTAKTRDDSFLELHCIAPTGGNDRKWEIKYPGGDFSPVPVPDWEVIYDFGEPIEPESEPLNQRDANGSSEDTPRFTQFNLTKDQVLGLINSLNSELNQTEIIERLWGCSKGGSAAWKKAYSEFKKLTSL